MLFPEVNFHFLAVSCKDSKLEFRDPLLESAEPSGSVSTFLLLVPLEAVL